MKRELEDNPALPDDQWIIDPLTKSWLNFTALIRNGENAATSGEKSQMLGFKIYQRLNAQASASRNAAMHISGGPADPKDLRIFELSDKHPGGEDARGPNAWVTEEDILSAYKAIEKSAEGLSATSGTRGIIISFGLTYSGTRDKEGLTTVRILAQETGMVHIDLPAVRFQWEGSNADVGSTWYRPVEEMSAAQ